MSYEGYQVFLCKNGHASRFDCNSDWKGCSHGDCNAPAAFVCHVDQTNGYIEDDPRTHRPEMEQTGFDDWWAVDHYGNKFARKINKYKPIGTRWRALTPDHTGIGK